MSFLLIAMKRVQRENFALHTEPSRFLTAPAGYYQPFKHPHLTRSPPIGVDKLSEVFMTESTFMDHCPFGETQIFRDK